MVVELLTNPKDAISKIGFVQVDIQRESVLANTSAHVLSFEEHYADYSVTQGIRLEEAGRCIEY